VAAEKLLRLSGTSSTSSAAGTMRLKRLIKPPAQPVVLDSFIFIVFGYYLHEMDSENVSDFSKRIKICSKGNACRMRFIWLSYISAGRTLLTFSVVCLQRGRYERFSSDFASFPVIFFAWLFVMRAECTSNHADRELFYNR